MQHTARRVGWRCSLLALVAVSGALPASAAPAAADPGQAFVGVWRAITPNAPLQPSPQLTAKGRRTLEQNRKLAIAGDRSFDGAAICLPPGIPRLLLEGRPIQILARASTVFFVFEDNHLQRRVLIGGKHDLEAETAYLGHSVGRWDKGALIIDTVGFNGRTLLHASGVPQSEKARVKEEVRLLESGSVLETRVTVTDPEVLSRPWTSVLTFRRDDVYKIQEDVCTDKPEFTAQAEAPQR